MYTECARYVSKSLRHQHVIDRPSITPQHIIYSSPHSSLVIHPHLETRIRTELLQMRRSALLLAMHRAIRIGVKILHDRSSKFTRRNTPFKQNIKLSICAALGLRKAEVAVHQAEEASASPEEGRLRAPVPRGGVQHAGSDYVPDDLGDVVEVSREDDGLLAETRGWDFGDEAVADGADRAVVYHGEDEEHGANGPLRTCVASWDDAEEAGDEEESAH